MQYQQKPSADTVESQRTAQCRPQSNNKPFNVGEFMLYVIYGTQVVVLLRDKALGEQPLDCTPRAINLIMHSSPTLSNTCKTEWLLPPTLVSRLGHKLAISTDQ